MSPLVQERLAKLLETQVYDHVLPEGYYSDKQLNDFEKEKRFILEQLGELDEETVWWADSEWEWFLNRTLDFLES